MHQMIRMHLNWLGIFSSSGQVQDASSRAWDHQLLFQPDHHSGNLKSSLSLVWGDNIRFWTAMAPADWPKRVTCRQKISVGGDDAGDGGCLLWISPKMANVLLNEVQGKLQVPHPLNTTYVWYDCGRPEASAFEQTWFPKTVSLPRLRKPRGPSLWKQDWVSDDGLFW